MGGKRAGRPIDRNKDRAILRAARALLFDQGPQAVTMEAVAARAGIAKATLYARHPDRGELLRAVIEAESHAMTRSLGHAPRTLDEVRASLMDFLSGLAGFIASPRYRRLMQAIAAASPATSNMCRSIYMNGPQRTHEALAGYLETAAAAGLIQCTHPLGSAEVLLGMLMGLDLVRAAYGMTPRRRQREARQRHVHCVVEAFLDLHRVGA